MQQDPGTGRENKKGIFEEWIADETHRCYRTVVSEPSNPNESDPTPSDVYNEATPFAFDYIPVGKRNTGALEMLNHILAHLTTEDEEAEYVLKFIADTFQTPRSNPQVMIVFKGHVGGVGKDTVNKLLHALLGATYVGSVGDMNLVFGTYNSVLDGKLLVQFNECESKQGHSLWNQIKDQVTADQNCIREKYLPNKWQTNSCRIVVSSNNQNPTPPRTSCGDVSDTR
jgi:phage/plasmid-associated DNA primase